MPKRPNQVHVYLSDEEVGMLAHVAKSCGLTHADVIRQALRSAYTLRLGVEIAKRAEAQKPTIKRNAAGDYTVDFPRTRKRKKVEVAVR